MRPQTLATTVPALLRDRAASSPMSVALYAQQGSQEWQALTWTTYWHQVQRLALGLLRLGITSGDRVAILAPTSLEWELAHMATLAVGGILVGLEPHDMPARLQRIAEHAEIKALVVQDGTLLEKLSVPLLPRCQCVITLAQDAKTYSDVPTIPWTALMESGGLGPLPVERFPAPTDPATIIYTSGTTGEPKGILYTHHQVTLACASILDVFSQVQAESRLLCWLPLANLFQRIMNLCAMALGATTYLVADPLRVLEVIPDVQPDIFIGVPRFYEKLYAGIQAEIARLPRWRQYLLRSAIQLGGHYAQAQREQRALSWALRALHALGDGLVLRRLRQVMGGRLQYMISGSAPMPRHILEFFHAMGLLILEAYGLSENVIPMAINSPNDFRFGSVGKPLPANDLRCSPEGELLVRGPGVFNGYYKEPEGRACFTAKGFYRTGDYATVDQEGFCYIYGRASEIIKTSGGRRIATGKVEAKLREIVYIDQALVYGHGRKCLVGLVTLDWRAFQRRLHGLDLQEVKTSPAQLSAPVTHQFACDLQACLEPLPTYERPVGFVVLRQSFSVAAGEMTPNLKLRRVAIEAKYCHELEALYDEIEQGPPAGAAAHRAAAMPIVYYV